MGGLPRLLVIIGSGEMAPRMARVQRAVVGRLRAAAADREPHGAVIDTPYGFQENAAELSAQAIDFFRRRLGLSTSLASFSADGDVVARERALASIRDADYLFSGPGSPSFALRHWAGSGVPRLLGDKLAGGGAVVFASAAALTLGAFTLPVYEIYKAGADPYWLPGLDVLGGLGIRAAVVPHYDNAEGGGHDTSFCFVGARRLAMLERELPDDTLILGLDEHTALVIEAAAERARVEGRGGVTIRRRDGSVVHAAGTEFGLDELRTASPSVSAGDDQGVRRADDEAALARRLVSAEQRSQSLERRSGLVGPLVEMLLEGRRHARAAGDYAMADEVRARLTELGIEINDEPDGSSTYDLPD